MKLICYTYAQHYSCAVLGLVNISWYASFTKKQGGICSHPKVARFKICETKVRITNLVLALDIMQVWLGYVFYRTGGSSWVFWMWFHWKGQRSIWSNVNMRSSHEFKSPRWNLCQDDQERHVDQIIMVKNGWSCWYEKANWSDSVISHVADSATLTGLTFDPHRSDRSNQLLKIPIGLHQWIGLVE